MGKRRHAFIPALGAKLNSKIEVVHSLVDQPHAEKAYEVLPPPAPVVVVIVVA